MATPGPPRKPTALKLIAGNPGKKKQPRGEPKPMVEAPLPPKHLAMEARAEWERIAPMLVRLKLLTKLDRAALSAYCQAWSRHVEAEEQIARASALAFTHNGYPIVNPWITISKQAVDQMARFIGEFGLTPAARCRLSAPDPDADDPANDKAFAF